MLWSGSINNRNWLEYLKICSECRVECEFTALFLSPVWAACVSRSLCSCDSGSRVLISFSWLEKFLSSAESINRTSLGSLWRHRRLYTAFLFVFFFLFSRAAAGVSSFQMSSINISTAPLLSLETLSEASRIKFLSLWFDWKKKKNGVNRNRIRVIINLGWTRGFFSAQTHTDTNTCMCAGLLLISTFHPSDQPPGRLLPLYLRIPLLIKKPQ